MLLHNYLEHLKLKTKTQFLDRKNLSLIIKLLSLEELLNKVIKQAY